MLNKTWKAYVSFLFVLLTSNAHALNALDVLANMGERPTQQLLNQTIVLKKGTAYSKTLKLPVATPIQFEVRGIKNTNKGFNVFVMPESQRQLFLAKKRFKYYTSLSALNVTKYKNTAMLPKGNIAFVVANQNNIINSMQVQVEITANPKQ